MVILLIDGFYMQAVYSTNIPLIFWLFPSESFTIWFDYIYSIANLLLIFRLLCYQSIQIDVNVYLLFEWHRDNYIIIKNP